MTGEGRRLSTCPGPETVLGTLVTIRPPKGGVEQHALVYRDPVSGGIVSGRWQRHSPDPGDKKETSTEKAGKGGDIPRAERIPLDEESLQWLLPDPTGKGKDGVTSCLIQVVLRGERSAVVGLNNPEEFSRRRGRVLQELNDLAEGGGDPPIVQDYTVRMPRTTIEGRGGGASKASGHLVTTGRGKGIFIETVPREHLGTQIQDITRPDPHDSPGLPKPSPAAQADD